MKDRILAELVGTAFLVTAIIGSGIMASRLSPDDVGLQLLENSIATGAVLVALILALGGAFNPVATFGLVLVVFRTRPEHVAYAVGGYIAAAYWFTSSTSFANPAVTVARMFSDTFAGIAPGSVPMFLLMQVAGGSLALLLVAPRKALA